MPSVVKLSKLQGCYDIQINLQNRDGFIDKEDLHDMLASLGKDPTDEYLEDMMSDAPGAINFTMFLTLFGERLQGTDPEDVIRNAFGCFDEENQVIFRFSFCDWSCFQFWISWGDCLQADKFYMQGQ